MTATPDLVFRRLEAGDEELLGNLAAAEAGVDDPGSVNFGVAGPAVPFRGEEVFGLFIRGSLAGAAWFRPPVGGWAEVVGLLLAKSWWNTGLSVWMLGELARTADLSGAEGIRARIGHASPAAGESLADAGFEGPDPEEEGYPVGEWRRRAGAARLQ